MTTTTIIIIVAIALIALIFIIMFNSLISKRNQVTNAFASIDAYLKKRYDLIPNLIATVKQYMKHEQETLTRVTELRTKAISGKLNENEQIALNNELNNALRAINVAVENYPELKANTNFLQLQGAMNEVEEQISASRRAFNASINIYNNAVQMFPTSIFAAIMGMKPKPSFEANEVERQNISAKDLFNQ